MRQLLLLVLVPAAAAQQNVLARLEPKCEIAIEFLADTDCDGRAELVLVAADGQLDRFGLRAGVKLCEIARELVVRVGLAEQARAHALV